MVRLVAYLVEMVFVILVGRLLGTAFERLRGASRRSPGVSPGRPGSDFPRRAVEGRTVRDPVCGTFVSTELSHRLDRGGETLHFCSRNCLEQFEKNGPNR